MNTLQKIRHDSKAWYNPFTYIAGFKALWVGLLIILLTSVAGQFSGAVFPGVIDSKIGWEGDFWRHLSYSLIAWLCMVIVLYPMALLLSGSRVRLVDIAGTQALARLPMLVAALLGFFKVVKKVTDTFLIQSLEHIRQYVDIEIKDIPDPGSIATWEYLAAGIIVLATLLATVWMVAMMYHAYRLSSNLKGARAGISFAIGIFIAQVISNVAIFYWAKL